MTDDGTAGNPDGVVDRDDLCFFFAYDEGWRMVATYRSTDSSPKEQFVHHAAGMGGLGGYGGSSHIDAVVLRERDANSAWTAASDGVLEERLNYWQNWRADVVAIVNSAGKLVERARYSAYGIPTAFPTGDCDFDGDWDAGDSTDIGSNYTPGSAYAVRRDADLDGDVDAADVTHANSITGGYQTLGRDVLTSAAVRNRIGYAGYQYDPTFAGVDRHLYHVRHRVYDAEAGRWTRRDPLGYVDGKSVYEYVQSSPTKGTDSFGMHGVSGGCAGHALSVAGPDVEDRIYDCVQRSTHWSTCLTKCCDPNPAQRSWCRDLCEKKEAERDPPPCIRFPYGPHGPERIREWERWIYPPYIPGRIISTPHGPAILPPSYPIPVRVLRGSNRIADRACGSR